MKFRLVLRIIGILLLLEAVAMVACGMFALMDVVAGDAVAMGALFKAAGLTGGTAALMIAAGGWERVTGRIPRREAVVIVGLGWLLSSAFGGLPYLLCPPGSGLGGGVFRIGVGFHHHRLVGDDATSRPGRAACCCGAR